MTKFSIFIYEKDNKKLFNLRDNTSGIFLACGFGDSTIKKILQNLKDGGDSYEILDFTLEKFKCSIFEK